MKELKEINRANISRIKLLFDGLLKVTNVKIVINGIERVPKKSVIFLSNHFTRIETLILPYIIYSRLGIFPRSLAATVVFNALPNDFMESVGAVPVDFPDRDDLIAKSLLAGESWVIFPEGRMVKNKRVIDDGRFVIHEGDVLRERSPHTGAGMVALKTQMAARIMGGFAKKHTLTRVFGFDYLDEFDVNIVPLNITYYPMRVMETGLYKKLWRLITFLEKGDLSPRFEEELKVESSILSTGVEMTINFGHPRKISEYSTWLKDSDVFPTISEISKEKKTKKEKVKEGKAKKSKTKNGESSVFSNVINGMMNDYMYDIYHLTTVNSDHIIARLLKTMVKRNRFEDDLENISMRAYLSAMEIRDSINVSFNDQIRHKPESIVVEGEETTDSFIEMAKREDLIEIVKKSNGVDEGNGDINLVIKEKQFKWPQKFHKIRLLNTVEVIHNEINPLKEITGVIDETLKLSGKKLKEETARALIAGEEERFATDYSMFFTEGQSKDIKFGMPKINIGSDDVGVLLIHGYMASPEEMRPLNEYLVNEGFTVYSVRLMGHGTSPVDLKGRNWEDWFYSARVGYTILSKLVKKIYICGFSMGGALSWHLAACDYPKIKGIISISAAMKLVSRASIMAPALDIMDNVLKYIGLKRSPVQFVRNNPENPHINYFKNPIHGVDQLLELIKVVKGELIKVKVPALIIQGGNDPTVDPESAVEYFNAISSETKGLIWVDSPYHGIVYRGGDNKFKRIVEFIEDPKKGVEKSHTWIPG
jgi:esterase/lipase/1-acyl-sn-glycerol-3-phosphate acyltransferase